LASDNPAATCAKFGPALQLVQCLFGTQMTGLDFSALACSGTTSKM